ncbi:MAG TPA: GNAT family N-acetyltransferase [Gemmatimonadales bacterium]|nr:GNAT family N-acetyltransferase [Gemmatimonadales bacterium]
MTVVAPAPVRRYAEEPRAVSTILLAFAADPMFRWCWPDAQQYLEAMPAFTRARGGRAFPHQTAFCAMDYQGAALWLPPGIQYHESAVEAVLRNSVHPALRDDLFTVLEQMDRFHPEEPHWYLPLIGVEPAYQGRGFGSLLLQHVLERCDSEGHMACLEATSLRNIPLYQRHGFEMAGTIQVGSSPPIIPMVRTPRGPLS